MTQVSIRIDERTNKGLGKAAEKLHIRKSDVIRIALADFLQKTGISEGGEGSSIYDRLKPFIGVSDSGISDLSTHPKHLAKRMKKATKR